MGTRKGDRGYHHRNRAMDGNKIRVRGKRLDEIDNTKLSLAYWLLAKQLVVDKTDGRMPNEDDVRRLAESSGENEPPPAGGSK
jgi:hypothetical protein